MKAFSTLVLLAMAFSAYAATPKAPDTVIRSSNDTTYRCESYTSNKIDPVKRASITDNPIIEQKTIVIQTKEGFIIKKGDAFKKQRVLTNNQMGSLSGMAGDPNTLLLQKENNQGGVYFITYLFEDSPGYDDKGVMKPGANTGLIVMADCHVTK